MRVFAFDHRTQLEEMEGATPARIGAFKQLCLQAALEVQAAPGYGILCDNRLGRAAHAPPPAPASGSAACEWPGSRPLTLEPELGSDCGGLVEWAREDVVKVLCFCHPDDTPERRAEQGGDGQAALGGLAPQPARVPARDHPVQGRPSGR